MPRARKAGFDVKEPTDAVKNADFVMVLLPDENIGANSAANTASVVWTWSRTVSSA